MTDKERIAILEEALRVRDRLMLVRTPRYDRGGYEVGRTEACVYCCREWGHDEKQRHAPNCPCVTHPWQQEKAT
jgi:hypothetical protein